MPRSLASLASNLYAAVIEFRDALFQSKRAQFISVRAKRVGLDNVRTGFEICHMNAKHFFGARGIQLIHAALRTQ